MIVRSRSAIAPAVLAVVIIVIIAVAGAGAYVALSSKSSSASTSTVSSVSTSSSSSSLASSTSSLASSTTSTSVSSSIIGTTSSSSSTSSSTTAAVTSTSSTSSSSLSTVTSTGTVVTCSNTTNALVNLVPLLNSYSAMTLSYSGIYNGTNGPTPINYTASYNVVSSTSSQIVVNLTYKTANLTEPIMATISTNGTVISVTENGFTLSGAEGYDVAIGLFSGFIIEIENAQSLQVFTGTQFKSTGTSQVTIGAVSFTVTNYAADSYPVTFSDCGGNESLTNFSMSAGTPSGANVPVITYLNFVGMSTSNGKTTTVNFTLKVTALTVG